MTALPILTAGLALGVALQYFVIGLYVVPRLSRLVNNPSGLIRAGQLGAGCFFIGCAVTHLGIAVHTLTSAPAGDASHHVAVHVVPHVFQIAGGLTFILIIHTRLDVRITAKGFAQLEREREELLARLQHLASHDAMTGLLNRAAFDHALKQHLRYTDRYGPNGGLLYLDLDGFKQANDNLGHQAGDELLAAAGSILRSAVRETDEVARMGGDEFAVLLRDAGPRECEGTAERVVTLLRRIDTPAAISASVGVVSDPLGPDGLERADAAMYAAKRAGGNRYMLAAPATL